MTKPAFLTGSYAYGAPGPESDIDLIVFVSRDDLNLLGELSDRCIEQLGTDADYHGYTNSVSFRYSKLNLICVTDAAWYECWRRGTEQLVAHKAKTGKPVRRETAVAHFHKLRVKAGLIKGGADDR